MSYRAMSSLNLDPEHTACIGGRTVLTCRDCAGNAPRGAVCASCNGRGFGIFVCAHCNPAAAALTARNAASSAESSKVSSPASLSRSSSTSVSSRNDLAAARPWKRFGDGDGGPGGGRIGTSANTPRSV
ncbi:hypothetical protein Asppvi_001480 [Aspergillus pseudoviridinutans]|uniref:Uncharacterized protein n=1 Tax=Aspergillus pseudoviridinutans TaxID=1517512 RepID=A0A9P3B557_9EURO|nr:uncharacterized protein Asppvi_001480 [Aspergillus pseudoviridinutans]GIJ82963.1 hypothetical protein Asppvi_001480 [Aspergillus pseudoviridinutans]